MHDMEKSLMLLVQLRDEIQEVLKKEIEKISESAQKLDSSTTKFIAHFDDFKQLSSRVEGQIAERIKDASERMADLASKRFVEGVTEGTQAN